MMLFLMTSYSDSACRHPWKCSWKFKPRYRCQSDWRSFHSGTV